MLTVEPRGNDWAALVLEKLEAEIKDNSGKTSKIYVMGVARDGWRKLNDNQWTHLSSELTGPATVEGRDSADRKLVTK